MMTDDVVKQTVQQQNGVITRRQLLCLGYTGKRIDRRIETGALRIAARGVYTTRGTRETWDQRLFVAWLTARHNHYPTAFAGATAAALHGFPGYEPGGCPIMISQPNNRQTIRVAAVLRRSDLEVADLETLPNGLVVTTPLRTVLDLAMSTTRRERVESVITMALDHEIVTLDELTRRFDRLSERGKPGCKIVRHVLAKTRPLPSEPTMRPDGFRPPCGRNPTVKPLRLARQQAAFPSTPR